MSVETERARRPDGTTGMSPPCQLPVSELYRNCLDETGQTDEEELMGTKKWAEIKKLSKATDADRAEARAELEEEIRRYCLAELRRHLSITQETSLRRST